MVDKNHRSNNEKYTKWSIRRLSVGVASVVVASGFFILISNPVNAQVGTKTRWSRQPRQIVQQNLGNPYLIRK